MRTLLAIFSCHQYEYSASIFKDWFSRPVENRIQGIRDSWLKDVTCDYRIFKGQSRGIPAADEVFLPAIDDYHHSTDKLKALLRWALDRDYEYLLKVDDDVFVYWNRLLANMPTADYVGSSRGFAIWEANDPPAFISDWAPGFTYGLTRRSMECLLDSPMKSWAEDRWVGESLRWGKIPLTVENRFHLVKPTRASQYISEEELGRPNDYLTIHSLSPDQMRRHYDNNHRAVQA